MKAVLVTGARGFIGGHLCAHLVAAGWRVQGSQRGGPDGLLEGIEYHNSGDIDGSTDWRPLLVGIDAVVHLAARVHVLRDTEPDPLVAFRRVNVAGTERLARQAADAGIQRFVYMSSIGALAAEQGRAGGSPTTPYQQSKWEAEQALGRVAAETGLNLVILRPPLVYGPGAPGNFARVLAALRRGLPLPLARVRNRRSALYVGNLVDAVSLCLRHSAAPDGIFALSDGEAVSTPELLRRLAQAYGRTPHLFPCPSELLRLGGRLAGHAATVDSLIGDLVVDDSAIRDRLGWRPPYDMITAMAATAEAEAR